MKQKSSDKNVYYSLTTSSSHKSQKEHQAIITVFNDVQNVLNIGVSDGPIKFESARILGISVKFPAV